MDAIATQHRREGFKPFLDTTDVEIFAALHTCAYRATRRSRKEKISAGERLRWANRWKTIRDHLVERNLGLAYSTLSRFRSDHRDWEDLRSEGLLALTRAVEGFNPWRGFRFSTYACHSIIRSFVHLTNKSTKYRLLFPMEMETYHEPPTRIDGELELWVDRLFRVLNLNLGELTDRESTVIAALLAKRWDNAGDSNNCWIAVAMAAALPGSHNSAFSSWPSISQILGSVDAIIGV